MLNNNSIVDFVHFILFFCFLLLFLMFLLFVVWYLNTIKSSSTLHATCPIQTLIHFCCFTVQCTVHFLPWIRAHSILDVLCFVRHHWVLPFAKPQPLPPLPVYCCCYWCYYIAALAYTTFLHSLRDRCSVLFPKSRFCELMWNVFVTDHTNTHTHMRTPHGLVVFMSLSHDIFVQSRETNKRVSVWSKPKSRHIVKQAEEKQYIH